MLCAHFACDMHCISDARMRSKLGYKQASLLSYHGVCDRRNRCLICIECCVCDCVLSSLSLSLSHGVCNRRSRCAFCIECGCCTRISFSVICSGQSINIPPPPPPPPSMLKTIESVRGQSLDLMSLCLRNKERKSIYIYMHIHIYPDMSAL